MRIVMGQRNHEVGRCFRESTPWPHRLGGRQVKQAEEAPVPPGTSRSLGWLGFAETPRRAGHLQGCLHAFVSTAHSNLHPVSGRKLGRRHSGSSTVGNQSPSQTYRPLLPSRPHSLSRNFSFLSTCL